MRHFVNWLLLLPMLCWAAHVGAQSTEGDGALQESAADPAASAALTIATREAPPFAFKDADGQWSGIAIELWNQIAEQNGFDFHYTELGLTEMLDATATGSVDAAVAALTITSAWRCCQQRGRLQVADLQAC